MIRCRKLLFFCLLLFSSARSFSQSNAYTTFNAHAHNDYNQDTPFYKAFRHGFGSIEADVFSVDGELFVAHDRKNIQPENTLSALYLQPLSKTLAQDKSRRAQLLVDVKGSPDTVLPILIQQLQPLENFCKEGRLTVLISGNRPPPSNYSLYSGLLSFDDDLVQPHNPKQWERVGLVSLQYTLFSVWKGIDTIPKKDEDRLRRIVNSVHNAGKKIRFWDAPDNEAGWKELIKLGVDFIGTDKIESLHRFLVKQAEAAGLKQ